MFFAANNLVRRPWGFFFSYFYLAPVAVEGKVEHECHLKPKITDEYRRMMRKRTEETTKNKRSIQIVDSVHNGIHLGAIPHASEADLINKVASLIFIFFDLLLGILEKKTCILGFASGTLA